MAPSLLTRDITDLAIELAEASQSGARVVAELRKEQARMERAFQRELHPVLVDLGELVYSSAEAQGGILIEASRDESGRIMAILEAANIKEWSKKTIGPKIEAQWKKVLDSTLRILGAHEIEVTDRDKLEQKILLKGGTREGLLDLRGDAKDSLFRVLEDGRERGLNPRESAKLIKQYVPEGRYVNAGSRYRAELIARTEVLEAQRHSSISSYEDSPVVKGCVAFDGDFDAECIARNGTEFTFQEAYNQADGTHPNCVLAFGPVT